MQKSIVVEHQEGADWALVLVATRSDHGRRSIVPMIFANKDCGIFAVAPQLKQWIATGLVCLYNPPPDRREELLKNAVIEFVRQCALRSFICERSRVGIVAKAKARRDEFDKPPEGFELSSATEPAFFWLCSKSETAVQTMRVARYLIEKNKIGELSQAERDALGLKLLTRGESLKNVFQRSI
jgi:hypothetical protein